MYKGGIKAINVLMLSSLLLTGVFNIPVQAATDVSGLKEEADSLNGTLQRQKNRVQEIQGLINTYADRIKGQETQKVTLENEVLLLDNRIREKELRIEQAKAQTDVLTLELSSLDANIQKQEERLVTQKALVADLVRRIRQMDDVSTLQVFLSRPSISSYADRLEEMKKLESDLGQTMKRVMDEKVTLENDKKNREATRSDLLNQRKTMAKDQVRLEMERNSKQSLISATNNKQDEFNRLLDELRQQKESTADEISNIEKTLKDKLNAVDEALAKGENLLLWPVPVRKITTTFHDPTYPFRYLFEHPGIDLRADVGTTVHAAAGGYVAWNKTGKMYGNYIMVIHPGNIATIYAHLSKFIAKPNTYVERGDLIGLSGGMPGMQGAGLSTGPHLHFEVRQDGIPVDPEGFLPVAVETDEQ